MPYPSQRTAQTVPPKPKTQLLRISEVRRLLLRVMPYPPARQTIVHRIQDGTLRGNKLGGVYFVESLSVTAWIEQLTD